MPRHIVAQSKAWKAPSIYFSIPDVGQKLARKDNKNKKLLPSLDYQIREEGGPDWIPLGYGQHGQTYRHQWVMKLRMRPDVRDKG